ncbi:hypothetical protein J7E70_07980 [Variovorax paradoxus]|nr:hypothetical protein [Variovorax paradoxus]MBT2300402.1 hypothetical protein [Variovorax paradoxus]
MSLLLVALLLLSGCGDDVETKIAQCQMSPDSERVGIPVCMSSMGYATVKNDFCAKMLYQVNAHVSSCYEQRGLLYRLKHL